MESTNTTQLLTTLIQKPSVTPEDGGILDYISGYLEDFESVRIDEGGVKNLFASKRFGEGPHLCFAGHIDVVPPGEGWDFDPYSAQEHEGFMYGRGTQDMKVGVAAMVQALKECESFSGTLSLLITSDEEGDAIYGTVEVLRQLKVHKRLPDFCVIGEPTCEERFGDAIKVGRRGSINGKLVIAGTQGHAAYPEKSVNPIDLIADKLDQLAGHKLDNGDDYFAPSRLIVTDIRAGMEVCNVTPGELKMMFNVRNSTKTDVEKIENYVQSVMGDLPYTLELNQSSKPFITDSGSKVVTAMTKSIESVLGVTPKHSTAGGTSDARFMGQFGVDVVEFGVRNDRIHAVNERVPLEDIEKLKHVYAGVIQHF